MSYLKGVVKEEYGRLKALCEKYRKQIAQFPRGSLSIKKRGLNEYLYLAYRDKGKVIFEYAGPLRSKKAQSIIHQVRSRKEYEAKLKQSQNDLKEIEKVVNGRKL